MEDLTEKINKILNDPEMMNNLKNISGLLGSSEKQQTREENTQTAQEEKENSSCIKHA